jgi:hypothetical protein
MGGYLNKNKYVIPNRYYYNVIINNLILLEYCSVGRLCAYKFIVIPYYRLYFEWDKYITHNIHI